MGEYIEIIRRDCYYLNHEFKNSFNETNKNCQAKSDKDLPGMAGNNSLSPMPISQWAFIQMRFYVFCKL